jgi:uncharacterized membrane protein YfcA
MSAAPSRFSVRDLSAIVISRGSPNLSWVIVGGLCLLALLSGMLGLGVAFASVPFLSLFMPDLVHQVQPLSLLS